MNKPTSTIASLTRATAISLGVTATLLMLFTTIVAFVESRDRARRTTESLYLRPDGTPLIASYRGGDYLDRSYRSLDGKNVEVAADAVWLQETTLPARTHHGGASARTWTSRILGINDGRQPASYWYYVHEPQFDERGYFVGMDSRSRLPIGFVGRGGHSRTAPSRDDQFAVDDRGVGVGAVGAVVSPGFLYSGQVPNTPPMPGSLSGWLVFMIAGDEILEVNLREHGVRRIRSAEDVVSLAVITQGATPTDAVNPSDPPARQWLAVRYSDRVELVDPADDQPTELCSYPIPPEQQQRHVQPLIVSLTDDGTLVFRSHASSLFGDSTTWRYTQVTHEGDALHSDDVTLANTRTPLGSLTPVSPLAGPVIPSFVGLWAIPHDLVSRGLVGSYAEAVAVTLREAWPALLVTYLASGLAAYLCYRRQRRYGATQTAIWVALVVILGLPGLLGYVWSRRWPPRSPCPECGETTCRNRVQCQNCGVDIARPPLLGTEVFA